MTTTERRYTITEHTLVGQRGEMRYWQSGPRQGIPVVLVHGYGAMIEHWRRVMRPIAREHTLYALDLYYFGYSARPREAATKEIWTDQIAEFISEVVGEPAIVVGHSIGGVPVSQLAYDYPAMVKGLALVNSTGVGDPNEKASFTDKLFFELIRAPGFGEMMASVIATPNGVRQGLMSAYHRKEMVTEELVNALSGPVIRFGGSSYLAVSRSFDRFSLDIKPGAIQVPALIIWGKEDHSIPVAVAEMIRDAFLPHAEISIIPNSGHCPFDETPQEFCDIFLQWSRRVSG